MNRRQILATLSFAAAVPLVGGGTMASAVRTSGPLPLLPVLPRCRMLFVNDLSGDVDGLFAVAHAVLSPSIDMRGIIGTSTRVRGETAQKSVSLAQDILRLTGRIGVVPVSAGLDERLISSDTPLRSPGVQAIIDEARRTDSALPLYIAVGGGLTEVASALMIDPGIADKFTLIWIGGQRTSGGGQTEYNFGIDPLAAHFVFEQSDVAIWQVPREAYATCMVSLAELYAYVAPSGPLGKWLYDRMLEARAKFAGYRMNTGETWTLGDNPLILLTALTDWVPSAMGKQQRYERTGSSLFEEEAVTGFATDGTIEPRDDGREIRIYDTLDTRLMMHDFFAKLQIHAGEKM